VLRRFSVTVRSSATRHGGRILKQIGDAFMLVFTHPADAIGFGLAMDRFVDAEPQFPALHIGAHCGSVLYREGDYVGATINLAPRVASAGAAGQILDHRRSPRCSRGSLRRRVRFATAATTQWNSRSDPSCRGARPQSGTRETDPVCGMRLHPDDVTSRATWRGMTFALL
jgi:adenylate cyclase